MSIRPDRVEHIHVRLKLDKTAAMRHLGDLRTILDGRLPEVSEGDTLLVAYAFYAQYFGDVVRKLEAVNSLIRDPGVVVDGSIEELIHGRSLIREVLSQLDRLIDREAKR